MSYYTIESEGKTKAIVDLDDIQSVTPRPEAGRPFIEIRLKGDKRPLHVDVAQGQMEEIMNGLNKRLSKK